VHDAVGAIDSEEEPPEDELEEPTTQRVSPENVQVVPFKTPATPANVPQLVMGRAAHLAPACSTKPLLGWPGIQRKLALPVSPLAVFETVVVVS
jgi:hypothetical protein